MKPSLIVWEHFTKCTSATHWIGYKQNLTVLDRVPMSREGKLSGIQQSWCWHLKHVHCTRCGAHVYNLDFLPQLKYVFLLGIVPGTINAPKTPGFFPWWALYPVLNNDGHLDPAPPPKVCPSPWDTSQWVLPSLSLPSYWSTSLQHNGHCCEQTQSIYFHNLHPHE